MTAGDRLRGFVRELVALSDKWGVDIVSYGTEEPRVEVRGAGFGMSNVQTSQWDNDALLARLADYVGPDSDEGARDGV